MTEIKGQYQNQPPVGLISAKETPQKLKISTPLQTTFRHDEDVKRLQRKVDILAAFATVQNKIIKKLTETPDSKALGSKPLDYKA
jgi:hypothetical protein